jgi:undecaprenyl-diphosphatase
MQNMKVPTISNNFALGVLLAGTFLICFIMILNVFLDMPLFIMGLNFIYKYQQSVPYSYYHTIQNALSTFAHPALIGAVLVIYYIVVNRKLLLIVHVSYFIFATYIIAILKQAFQQSRPIWYDSKINNWEWFCWKDFGNPSGHSFAVILLYEPIISDSIGYWKYRPWSYVLAILCVLVPISRMYLGVHSLNQILFGLSLGTVFLILYKYIYQKALYDLYW